jgi:hypothetical protein
MKAYARELLAAVILTGLLLAGCFPSKRVTMLKPEMIAPGGEIKASSKAFLWDSSCVLFPNGFRVENNTLTGEGQRYWRHRAEKKLRNQRISLDSVAAMTYYQEKSSAGSVVASGMLGVWGGFITALSIRCIACPKCCFGSCPTVYTYTGENAELEAELFSYSISRYFQETDLDRLAQKVPADGRYRVRITNEALETHYIDKLILMAVNHPRDTQVFPGPAGDLVCTRNLQPPASAINARGKEVTTLLQGRDEHWYRSDTGMVGVSSGSVRKDWLDLTIRVPAKAVRAKLVLRYRNTLLTTLLFYEVVLASQGISALEWIEKMNSDPAYATQFYLTCMNYAGITVNTRRNGRWERQTWLRDSGPIAWKYAAVAIPLEADHQRELAIRLEFFPDNFMIDHVAFDFDTSAHEDLIINEIVPSAIRGHTGVELNAKETDDIILSLIQKDDEQFLVTNPGESFQLTYEIAPQSNRETTVFLQSNGYYTEWLRGQWLTTRPTAYRFDLTHIDQAVRRLRESWLADKALLEEKFFQTRIPLKEEL